jgi:hypothetical protein
MRKGDEQMEAGQWNRASKYYLGALDVAGETATGQLWQKYNKAYSKDLVERSRSSSDAQLSRHQGSTDTEPSGDSQVKISITSTKSTVAANSLAVNDVKSSNDSKKPEVVVESGVSLPLSGVTTTPSYVEILPDGTVRMSLSDYMKDTGLAGSSTANGNSGSKIDTGKSEDQTPVEKASYSNAGHWGEPVVSSTGDRKTFGSSEKVGLSGVLSEATSDDNIAGDVEIATQNYVVSNIKIKFVGARKLRVTGDVTNKSKSPIHNARAYVRLYNETGVFKGRKWSYLNPGRQSLGSRKTKKFDIEFGGYTGTVGSYKIEVLADFKN